MMVLSRKKNESLIINGNILVTVVEIRGDKVRLGIEYPKEVSVHRQEVFDAIRRLDTPTSFPLTTPPAHITERPTDALGEFAAALQANLGVLVNREVVVQAMREASIDFTSLQNLPK